ncbi:MAG: class I SAM-dependent methyltransferase [Bacteroidetes bacterium]|nr:class I SAM-dependent methyltransferase [Bacteroidota bacterium]
METIITYSTCPVCDSSDISHVLSPKDYTVSNEVFEVWHCNHCQVRFTQNIPGESEIGKYYQSEEYISHSNTSKGIVNRLYQIVREYTLTQKRKLVERLSEKKSGSILDIGCGTGEFLGTMKSAGWKTLGLEPSEDAQEQARKNFQLDVYDNEHLFELSDNSFDVITMWHVLEHVHKLHEYLDKINSLLTSDGLLIIAVPNYQSLDADVYQKEWAAYDVPRHLYHFSPPAMEMLLKQHNLKLEKLKRMPFDAFYVSLLSEKYKYGKLRLISAFFTGFRSWLQNLSRLERGSSVLYVIRKKD